MSVIRNLCIAILLTLISMSTIIFFTNFPGFELEAIQVEGNQKLSYSDVLSLCPVKLGENLFSINTERIKKKILSEPKIEYVQIKRSPPHKIIIRLSEKKPALLINLENIYGLTRQGEIIPLDENFNLPMVSGVELKKTKPYQKLKDQKVNLALSLYGLLVKIDKDILNLVSEINLKREDNVILYLIPKGTKISLGYGDFKRKLVRLSLILKQEIELDKVEYIDLRFKEQAVVRRFD